MAHLVTCSLCGTRFDCNEAASSCSGCPISHGCKLIRCPHCGYETPAPTPFTRWLSKWFGRRESA